MNPVARPYIFISIPRSASSTVHYLLGLTGPKDFSRPSDAGITDNHARCQVLRERYGQAELGRRFKFAFVRNPWDRCVSWYHHQAAQPPYCEMTFSEWVRAGLPHHWNVQNGTTYGAGRTPLVQRQFIVNEDDGTTMVDFIGRVERFRDDMAAVAKEIGLALPAREPRINRCKNRASADYRRYYDDATAERVGQMLETDVRTFDYRF